MNKHVTIEAIENGFTVESYEAGESAFGDSKTVYAPDLEAAFGKVREFYEKTD